MTVSIRPGVKTALLSVVFITLLTALTAFPGTARQGQRIATPVSVYITAVVQDAQGPESGVWVIAETKDLFTNFIKIVVTDDQGRFMLPDLPNANYSVWVRGYGLVDSAKIEMKPSTQPVTLKATAARTPQEAAKVYPG